MTTPQPPAHAGTIPGLTAYLYLTSITCGTLIMVIEVLGSRVIGPFFGVSLFVWTSLIAVTMIALAAGYALGGLLADRRARPDDLYLLILLAGVSTLLVPLLKGPVLRAGMALGLRGGSFASALLLFGPALLLLGCVSPLVIRFAARELHSIGRTVGGFYALSTVGSIVGTVATGFVLVAWLGVDQIFFLVGALLLLLALGYFALLRRKWPVLLALVLLPALLPGDGAQTAIMPDGTRAELVAKQDSHYGNLKVIDYSYGAAHTRELLIDGLVQGGIDLNSGQSIYPYSYILGVVPQAIAPGGKRCLVVGLGAGIIPGYYRSRGVAVEVVDIDPAVAQLAARHFAYPEADRVHIEDARTFLAGNRQGYDYIVLDVFNGDTTPGHLLSLEAFTLLRRALNPGGVLAVNSMGSLRHESRMTASVVRTLEKVFETVDLYANFDPAGSSGIGNLSLFAYSGPHRSFDASVFAALPVHPLARDTLLRVAGWRYQFPGDTPHIILRDNYNPIDCFDLWLKEKVREDILRTTDWSLLIGRRDLPSADGPRRLV